MYRTTKASQNLPVDEFTLAKSAACAWHQRGSGSDGKLTCESDVRRTKVKAKPSRFKQEALPNVQTKKLASNSPMLTSSTSSIWSRNPLLDNYEIERISRQLDYYVGSIHAKHRGRVAEEAVADEIKSNISVVQKKNMGKWFQSRHVPVACGSSRDDVVENRMRSRPEKGHVAVVDVVGCRPRGAHVA